MKQIYSSPSPGTVEPFSELDCEVVWHPSFSSPLEGDFDLCVHEGNTQRLHCVAKVWPFNRKITLYDLLLFPWNNFMLLHPKCVI